MTNANDNNAVEFLWQAYLRAYAEYEKSPTSDNFFRKQEACQEWMKAFVGAA